MAIREGGVAKAIEKEFARTARGCVAASASRTSDQDQSETDAHEFLQTKAVFPSSRNGGFTRKALAKR